MSMPGPGDPETWGPVTGHPNDPRVGDVEEEDEYEPDWEAIAEDRAYERDQAALHRMDKEY
jgi:hypothetical protein